MGPSQKVGFNWGDFLHAIEIFLLVLSLGMGYQRMQDGLEQIKQLQTTVTRIDHYLSSKDLRYWDHQ